MRRILILVLTLLLGSAGAIFFLLENPDRFRRQITQLLSAESDYQLQIHGELQWRYWPPIAIEVRDIEVTDNSGLHARLQEAEIELDLWPLLTQGRITDINRLTLAGGSIRLQENDTESPDVSGPGNTVDQVSATTIHEFHVRDVSVTSPGKVTHFTINELTTTRLAMDAPFDFRLQGSAGSGDSFQTTLEASGRLLYQSATGRIRFEDIVMQHSLMIEGRSLPAMSITARGEWRLEERAVTVTDSRLSMRALQTTFTGIISLKERAPRAHGVINAESADLPQLAALFDITTPITTLQFDSDIQLTPDLMKLQTLEGRFDETDFKGQLAIRFEAPVKFRSDLRLSRIDLNEYASVNPSAPPAADLTNSPGKSTAEATELIPTEFLREFQLDTIFRVSEFITADYNFKAAKFELHANREQLEATVNAQGMGGKLLITGRSSLASSTETSIGINVDKVDVRQLAQTTDITGSLSGHSNLQFTGTTLDNLLTTLTGNTVFSIRDGSLDVTPIKRMAQTIDALRGKRSRISDWPDQVPFNQMTGEHQFVAGTQAGQVLAARVENINLMAIGGFNLVESTLDYDITAILEARDDGPFKVSDQVAGIRWPLECRGEFTASPADLCFSEEGAIQHVVEDILKQDLKRRGKNKVREAIEEQLPDELKGITEGLLRGIFD